VLAMGIWRSIFKSSWINLRLTRSRERRESESLSKEVLSVELVEEDSTLWGSDIARKFPILKLLGVLR